MLPNFLIIGAVRCATGWISQCLREHPSIYMASDETHFFDRHYSEGLDWWEQNYFNDWKNEKVVGEKTANYLHNSSVPLRIASSLPGIKLICCLRDPIDRMYSHYIFRNRGESRAHDAHSFMQDAHLQSDLVQRGQYFKQLKWYLELFPIEDLLVKIYEDKDIDEKAFIQEMYNFLNVEQQFVPSSINLQTKLGAIEHKNQFWRFMSRFMNYRKSPIYLRLLYQRIRPKEECFIKDEDCLFNLALYFKKDIEQLEQFLNRDLNCWKTKNILHDFGAL